MSSTLVKKPNSFSVHLDAIRGLAALAVFYEHMRALFFREYKDVLHPNVFLKVGYFLDGFGHIAVMIFFVLSGFLISSSVLRAFEQGRWSWSWYAQNRLTRLYVVLIPALILTTSWDHFGIRLLGLDTIYSLNTSYHHLVLWKVNENEGWQVFVGNVLFLQNFLTRPLGSNSPLWSLSNEFWYYVLFPISLLAASSKTPLWQRISLAILAFALLAFIGKEISLYYVVWLMGTALSLLPSRKAAFNKSCILASLLLLLLTLTAARLQHLHSAIISDFLVAITFTLFLYFLRESSGSSSRKNFLQHPIYEKCARFLSGFSYTLYLVHMPFLFFASAYFIGGRNLWQPDSRHVFIVSVVTVVTLAYTLLIWRLTEANTDAVRGWLQRCFAKLSTTQTLTEHANAFVQTGKPKK